MKFSSARDFLAGAVTSAFLFKKHISEKRFSRIPGCLGLLLLIGADISNGQDCKPSELALIPTYSVGENAFNFTSADFNGDGKLDVAVNNTDRNTISVVFGDGAGGFGPPIAYPTGTNVNTIAAGDLNSDGKPDLVGGFWADSKITIMLNNGNGGFGAPATTTYPPAVSQTYELKIADLNGDGFQDIVSLNNQEAKKLNFFLGNGRGTVSLASTVNFIGRDATIAVGKINGDNIPDIAIFYGDGFTSRNVGYVLGNQSGTFSANFAFSVDEKAVGIEIVDLNHDSLNDLAIAFEDVTTPTTHLLRPFFGNGGGAFSAGARIDLIHHFPPSDLAVGDYNGDGNIDMAAPVAGKALYVIYGTGTGAFQNESFWTLPEGSSSIISSDINGDSTKDLIVLQGSSSFRSTIGVAVNNKNSGFEAPQPLIYGYNNLGAEDFNSDGHLDFVSSPDTNFASNYDVILNLNDTHGRFPTEVYWQAPVALAMLRTGDFNGDGKKDVITAHANNGRRLAVYFGDGNGVLAAPPLATTVSFGFDNIIVEDFNGDGKDDVFATADNSNGYTLLNNGNGTFSIAPNFPIALSGSIVRLGKGDFNHDNKTDIVVSTGGPNTKLLLGTGNGQFTPSPASIPEMNSMVVGDLNGDGNLDVAGIGPGGVRGVLGDGTGGFGPAFDSLPFITGSGSFVISGDFNSDDSDDLALILGNNRNGTLAIVPSTPGSSGVWQAPLYFSVGGLGDALFTADFNNDKKPDIAYSGNFATRGVIFNRSGSKPCVSINDATITEGDSATSNAAFTVNLSAASSEIVRVNYSLTANASNGAQLGTDVQNISGRIAIPAGQTSATINVPVIGDLVDEFDEGFTVTLAGPTNAALGSKYIGAGTIVDNDPEPTMNGPVISVVEAGSPILLQYQLNLSAPSEKLITVHFDTADGTATAGSDYLSMSGTISFPPGQTTSGISIFVASDSIPEPNETVFLNLSSPVNGVLQTNRLTGFIIDNDVNRQSRRFDFDGDGKTDISIFRPSEGVWWYLQSLDGADRVYQFGNNVDKLAPADFTGDGKTDIAFFRPSTGEWYVLRSEDAAFYAFSFGSPGDIPAPADFDGDNRADAAVYRPSNSTWYILRSSGGVTIQQFGLKGDIPTVADYDGDGKADIAIYRPSLGQWWVQRSTAGLLAFQFGTATDKPVEGDYTGDGKADIAIYRPSTGEWFVLTSETFGVYAFPFGAVGDIPAPGDYEGDGKADAAVYRPSTGTWYVLGSTSGVVITRFGAAEDKPVPASFIP